MPHLSFLVGGIGAAVCAVLGLPSWVLIIIFVALVGIAYAATSKALKPGAKAKISC